jgi:voltage-dependent potassium channel beta subunit
MNYRRLGKSGIKVSELSFGSWVSFHNQLGIDTAADCMKTAYDAGINFFDNAEAYAKGKSEEIMGEVLKKMGWRRSSYLVSTKFYWGMEEGVNEKNTLNRKYLMQAIDGSLKRFQLEHLDLIYCHRPDAETPIEETVWALSDIISQGKALYWGTSEWGASQIMEAWQIAERHHLHKPVTEQPSYHMLNRERFEREYGHIFRDIGYGSTTFSPLAGGILSGKYNNGIPADSRATLAGYEWFKRHITPEKIEIVKKLEVIANGLGGTPAQLAIAWVLKNPNVSSVITGASKPEQVTENLKALDILPKLTPDIMSQIEGILNNTPRDWKAT